MTEDVAEDQGVRDDVAENIGERRESRQEDVLAQIEEWSDEVRTMVHEKIHELEEADAAET